MITVGLAGHIDHGKSSLVRYLTGVDPDRLPEEKARGMTIDLGFARWRESDEPGSAEVSFVDVPGHERFVRNMIAGAGGIEALILVVAADDGWMPQSQEHFDIVRLLQIERGIIAVTKSDLAEPDWLETVISDIRDRVAGSFLENAPIIPISSTTGAGFDQLKSALISLVKEKSDRGELDKPRLFADRAFVMPGMGKVVTGSMRGGSFSEGEEVTIYPDGITGKLRALQRHGAQAQSVGEGQRAALAFSGIDRDLLARGKVICKPKIAQSAGKNKFLIVRLNVLPDCAVAMKTRRKLLFFLGTSEIACELRMPAGEVIAPGTNSIVTLRMGSEPLALIGDPFILRLPTPQVTVGGGVVLGWSERIPTSETIERYKSTFVGEAESRPSLKKLLTVELSANFLVNRKALLYRSVYSATEINSTLKALEKEKTVAQHGEEMYHVETITRLFESLSASLAERFEREPHLKGLHPDEVARLLPSDVRSRLRSTDSLLQLARKLKILDQSAGLYQLPGRGISISGAAKKEAERILSELQSAPYSPPLIAALVKPGKPAREALGYLFDTNAAVKIGSELAFAAEPWERALQLIEDTLNSREELTVALLRSKLDTSRKYALPILEETDRRGITAREGDLRIKGPKFSAKVQK